MTIEFEFDPDQRLCIYRISGQITVEALLATFGRARAHADWSDDYNFLTLLDRVALPDMTAEAMSDLQARMAAGEPPRTGPRRRAAIVCSDELSRAMLTYWEMVSGETLTTEERVFTTEPAARAWLGEGR